VHDRQVEGRSLGGEAGDQPTIIEVSRRRTDPADQADMHCFGRSHSIVHINPVFDLGNL
jgi:hypothetical protein